MWEGREQQGDFAKYLALEELSQHWKKIVRTEEGKPRWRYRRWWWWWAFFTKFAPTFQFHLNPRTVWLLHTATTLDDESLLDPAQFSEHNISVVMMQNDSLKPTTACMSVGTAYPTPRPTSPMGDHPLGPDLHVQNFETLVMREEMTTWMSAHKIGFDLPLGKTLGNMPLGAKLGNTRKTQLSLKAAFNNFGTIPVPCPIRLGVCWPQIQISRGRSKKARISRLNKVSQRTQLNGKLNTNVHLKVIWTKKWVHHQLSKSKLPTFEQPCGFLLRLFLYERFNKICQTPGNYRKMRFTLQLLFPPLSPCEGEQKIASETPCHVTMSRGDREWGKSAWDEQNRSDSKNKAKVIRETKRALFEMTKNVDAMEQTKKCRLKIQH